MCRSDWDLTEYFARCVDESTITVDGQYVESGSNSQPIELKDGQARIQVHRTAADGQTKKKYVIHVQCMNERDTASVAACSIQAMLRGKLARARVRTLVAARGSILWSVARKVRHPRYHLVPWPVTLVLVW